MNAADLLSFPDPMGYDLDSAEDQAVTNDRDVCVLHDSVFSELKSVVNDLRWVIRFGKWFLGTTGGILLIMASCTVSLLVHVVSLNSRIAILESQLQESARDRASLRENDKKVDERLLQMIDRYHQLEKPGR